MLLVVHSALRELFLFLFIDSVIFVGRAEGWENEQMGIFIGVGNVDTGNFCPITMFCVAL